MKIDGGLAAAGARDGRRQVKCLVWDLDNTLWRGILAEGDAVEPYAHIGEVVRALDERGILLSIASKNDAAPALARLAELGMQEYFLHPQINWGPKSQSVQRIAERLNIGIDAIAFIDDQPFERDEVASAHPQVMCLDSELSSQLLAMPELTPRFMTDESRLRRSMYVSDAHRDALEQSFEGPKEEFLASLDMVFSIAKAEPDDLQRLEELVARTNQLNTTGRIYSLEDLDGFRRSPRHDLLAASLRDVYGEYGKIGLALVEKDGDVWTIKAFLMSCRVMSRGVGTVFIHWLLQRARRHGASLRAEMIPNERNRMMSVTYRFAGFRMIEQRDGVELLEHDLADVSAYPPYVSVVSELAA